MSRVLHPFGYGIWDPEKEIDVFSKHKVPDIFGFSPCGQYLVCAGEEILLWDIAHRKLHKTGLNQGPFISACQTLFCLQR